MIDAAISTSTSGGNHAPRGTTPNAAAMSVIECATVNAVMTPTRVQLDAAKRQHHAEQEQQVVEAAEDVREPGLHE